MERRVKGKKKMRGRVCKKQKRNINFTEAGKEDGSKEAIRAVDLLLLLPLSHFSCV